MKDIIEQMVSRFLGWKLPANFAPDCGISFKRESDYAHPEFGHTKYEPVGTNLFTADQAKAMFEYCMPPDTNQVSRAEYEALLEALQNIANEKHTCSNCVRRYDPDHYPCCSCKHDNVDLEGEDLWKPISYIKTAQDAIAAINMPANGEGKE